MLKSSESRTNKLRIGTKVALSPILLKNILAAIMLDYEYTEYPLHLAMIRTPNRKDNLYSSFAMKTTPPLPVRGMLVESLRRIW